MEAAFFCGGSARTAYGSIVGGGPNSAVLHFSPTSRPFADGELILMDAAGNCTLIDKGSTNGTFVNGVRVSEYALTHGVSIRVGSTDVRFLAQ